MHKLSGRKIAVVGNVAQNGAPQSSARRQIFVNRQNAEKPHPKMRFSVRKKEERKMEVVSGMGLIGSAPQKP
jgi:hypothetical protein